MLTKILILALGYTGATLALFTGAVLLGTLAGNERCWNIFRAQDKLFASFFFSGFYTLSAECGRCELDGSSWLWGVAVRKAIDLVFGAGHCRGAWQLESGRLPPERL